MPRLAWYLLALSTVMVLIHGAPAHAAGPERSVDRVEVVLAGPGEERDAMRAVLVELIGRLEVDVSYADADAVDAREVLTAPEGARPATARVWLELGESERVTCYLVDGAWERIMVRHVPLSGGIDEIAREELGHIVESSVDALLGGGEIGVSRVEAAAQLGVDIRPPEEPAPEAPAPSPEPAPRAQGVLGLGYQAQFWGGSVPAYHGPVLLGGVRASATRVRPGAMLTVQYLTPVLLQAEAIDLRLQGAALRVMATLSPRLGESLELNVAVGGGVDLVRVSPAATEDGAAVAADPYTAIFPEAEVDVGLAARLGRGLALRFDALVGIDMIDSFYFVAGAPDPLFDPWVVRPGLRATLVWSSGGR